MTEYVPSDKQYNGQLIEEFQRLERIKSKALVENAVETLEIINQELKYLKLKLQPLELPEED